MRMERSQGAIYLECLMFAVMAGIVGTVGTMVLAGVGLVSAVGIGIGIATVVYIVIALLMSGTVDPPRGPGDIEPTIGPDELSRSAPMASAALAPGAHQPELSPSASAHTAHSGETGHQAPAAAAEPASNGVSGGTPDAQKPVTLTAAREGAPDDLQRIKGVGPKLEEMLHGMGFYHYDQIANWTPQEVAWVDDNLEGFRGRVSRDDWVAQAQNLAAGGSTEFSDRSDKGEVH